MKQETRQMLGEFFPLLAAVAAQQILSLTVNLVDNFMLGGYSEAAMSGAVLTNQIMYLLLNLTSGLGAGVTVLGSQYWGKHQTGPIRRIISLGVKFGLGLGLLFLVVTSLFPHQIFLLFTEDEVIIAEAMRYLAVLRWSFVLYGISSVLMFSLQSVQTAFIGGVMSASTIVINTVLNSLLIYGRCGMPELGVQGAAAATLCSRTAELVIILVYVLKIDRKLCMTVRDLLRPDAYYLKDYVKVSVPLLVSYGSWGITQAAQTAVLGHVGSQGIAANGIASVYYQMFGCGSGSAASASAVIMGKTVGSGRMDLVRSHTKSLQVVFLCIGVFCGSLIFVTKDFVLSFYVISEGTRKLTRQFLTVLSFAAAAGCYEYALEGGVIAGGGDTRYPPIVDLVSVWLFALPLGCFSAFVMGWPCAVTFLLLKSDQFFKCVPNAIYGNSYRWVRYLTRE